MRLAAACLALAALSLLFPAAPGYDAWAWLQWGREVWDLALATEEGPAFKPLPVAATTLLAALGGAAPELWLLVSRAGAFAAVALAYRLAAQCLTPSTAVDGVRPPSRWSRAGAGLLAALGVLLTGGFVRHAAVGDAEPLLVGLLLAAVASHRSGRPRQALALAVAAALVRVEVWPFLAAYVLWRHRRAALPVAAGLALAWFLPELLSSGELLRSADRARVPNPGQPATADVPLLETLRVTLTITLVPLAVIGLARRQPLALAGLGWVVLVAAMSQAGFSGEARYLLPGAALLAVGGAAAIPGHGRGRGRTLAAVAVAATLPFAVARVVDVADLGPRLAYQQDLADDLDRVVADLGGRAAILRCGEPAVGRYRGTLLAYALDVPKRAVRADGQAARLSFTSRLTKDAPREPPPPPIGVPLADNARWQVYSDGSDCLSDWTGANRSPSSSTRCSTCPASNTSRSGSPDSWQSPTSSHVTGVDTVGRSLARSE